jgi:hypothetical protein
MRKLFLGVLILTLLMACSPESRGLLKPVDEYLVQKIGLALFGGKVFCAYDVLGTSLRIGATDVYVWALCGEYYFENDKLTLGTASSLPVAMHMQKVDGQYQVVRYEIPSDGSGFMPSIRRIFPADSIQKMCHQDTNCYNARALRLQKTIMKKAQEYYELK